jgi:hypothetical protein
MVAVTINSNVSQVKGSFFRHAAKKTSAIALIFFALAEPCHSKSYCTTEIERALEAQRLLLEGMRVTSMPALQGLASGYLDHNWLVCTPDDIAAVEADRYTISRGFSGTNDVVYIFAATHKSGCSLHLAIDTPRSRLRNIGVHCQK